jgi:hypothetical protein
MSIELLKRGVVFLLASLSFACLLGQFGGLWTMHWFGCWVLPPATAALAVMAWLDRPADPSRAASARVWVVEGAIGGLVAAVAYDLYRLPFVLAGKPLFKVMDEFGRLLLGRDEPVWLVRFIGWLYHFSNGAALGIMLLAMIFRPTQKRLFWGAVAWALVVEFILLQTPYPTFFKLPLNGFYYFATASAHLIFGIALGLWLRRRIPASAILRPIS